MSRHATPRHAQRQRAVDLSTAERRATEVKRVWNGFYSRWQEPAATEIQRWWRGFAARKLALALKKGHLLRKVPATHPYLTESACRVIQRRWRGYVDREIARIRRQAVITIQSHWKGYLARRVFPALRRRWRAQNDDATLIQAYVRGYMVRARLRYTARSLLLRAYWRHKAVTQLHVSLRDFSARLIQRVYRRWRAEKQAHRLQAESALLQHRHESAAVLIQHAWRRHHRRKQLAMSAAAEGCSVMPAAKPACMAASDTSGHATCSSEDQNQCPSTEHGTISSPDLAQAISSIEPLQPPQPSRQPSVQHTLSEQAVKTVAVPTGGALQGPVLLRRSSATLKSLRDTPPRPVLTKSLSVPTPAVRASHTQQGQPQRQQQLRTPAPLAAAAAGTATRANHAAAGKAAPQMRTPAPLRDDVGLPRVQKSVVATGQGAARFGRLAAVNAGVGRVERQAGTLQGVQRAGVKPLSTGMDRAVAISQGAQLIRSSSRGSAATKQGADLPAVEDQTQAPAPVSNAAMAGTRLLHEQVLGGRKTGATLKTRR